MDYKLYEDKVSGLIPFYQRPAGKKLIEDVVSLLKDGLSLNKISKLTGKHLLLQNQIVKDLI